MAMLLVIVTAGPLFAHPLGNFTINHLTRLAIARDRLDVRYTLDMAEIPTAQTALTVDASGRMTPRELAGWTASEAAKLLPQLTVAENGAPVALTLEHAVTTLRPGAGGLPTIYLTLDARGTLAKARGTRTIAYVDGTFATGHIGWRDVVVAPRTEPTRALTAYPSELLGSPRSTTAATIALAPNGVTTVTEAAAAVSAAPSVPASPLGRSNQLSDMLQHGTGDWRFVALTFLAAIVLGGLHALEPGHGKTLLAVSLVGARATVKQAGILASALTVAHTIGVLALGALILLLKDRFAPEAIYPWITLVSGCAIAVIGARAVQRQIANRQPLAHAHAHGHAAVHAHDHDHVHHADEDLRAHAHAGDHGHAGHSHDNRVHSHGAHDHGNGLHGHDHGGDHSHDHGDGHTHDDLAHARSHAIPGTKPLTFGATVLAAMSGGVAPCPAALVVLLAAVALDEVAYGIFVIVAFSAGLATTLTGLGIAVVRGATWLQNRPQFDRFVRYGPLVSAVVIATIGAIMVGQGFAQQGVTVSPMVVTLVVAAAIAGYAFSHPFGHAHRAEAA